MASPVPLVPCDPHDTAAATVAAAAATRAVDDLVAARGDEGRRPGCAASREGSCHQLPCNPSAGGRATGLHGPLVWQGSALPLSAPSGQLLPCRDCQLVRSTVLRIAGVTANPMPVDVMNGVELDEATPEVLVQYGCTGRSLPAIPLPPCEPASGERVPYVLRVGEDIHDARPLQGLERLDRSRQFHPVVGRSCFGTGYLFARSMML